MASALPVSQTVKRKLSLHVDKDLAAIADLHYRPVYEWVEKPINVVHFTPEPASWFKLEQVHRMSIDQLQNTPLGKNDDLILDFGSHRVGYLSFYLDAAGDNVDAPCRLRFVFGEVPTDVTEDLSSCNTWISTSWLPDEVINVDWLPCQVNMSRRYSFRYVRIQVLDTSQKYRCLFANIQVRATSAVSPAVFNAIPPLNAEDPLLLQVDKISQVTLRDCMQTVFEDGPRRDRRLWLGDLRIQALTNYSTFRDLKLVKRCLFMFAAVAASDGSLPACVFEHPTLRAASDYIVDYDALFGVVVYEYVMASSDLDTAKALWPTILGSLRVPLSHLDPETGSFVSSRTELWKFLDWDERLHPDAAMHGLLLFCLKRAEDLAALLGYPPPYTDVIKRMTTAATSVFLCRGVSGGGSRCEDGLFTSGPEKQISWLSHAWMTLAEVLPSDQSKRILVSVMHDPQALRPLCPYGWAVFAEALAKCGAKQECVSILKEYWGGMVERGADTFWECFDPNDSRKSPYGDCRNNSYCHAWSCSPAWLLRDVLKLGY
ncbi:glycoside hydrolase family 78 protein [Zopfia rhizophila CBS 207.26]|uniref:Glycoside hydrolase family 78 protein n=1 Tax=Zopfia rhizophila CBS 207.26 TaxID=1314779 RepID=A0A6A6EV20_9PEZI|nr:glycoside hydrolase family 78 protein [Zopfia rhizophila CBS 207.26]